MYPALWVAKTGLEAQEMAVNVITHNIANASTTSYKRARANFQDLIYQTLRQPGAQSSQNTQYPAGIMLGTGTRVASTEKIFTQGQLVKTDNPFNVAIQGRGFFEVTMPNGTVAYTRDGQFQVDSTGQLVTATGYAVQPAIQVPPGTTSMTIGSDGTVSAVTPAGTQTLTPLQLTDFINPAGLQPVGENLYIETPSSGVAQSGNPGQNGLGTLQQNNLETSNVSVVEELVNLIQTQRIYEISSKTVAAIDGMLQFVNQVVS